MAVIACPRCKKKISNKSTSCPHCQLDLSKADAEQLATLRKIETINKSQRIMMLSFIAMLLFCGGFLFFYWYEVKPGSWQYLISVASTAIGFCLYIITRVQLIVLKRKSS
jgi:uncharacterized protein YbaR (Trm112 family)